MSRAAVIDKYHKSSGISKSTHVDWQRIFLQVLDLKYHNISGLQGVFALLLLEKVVQGKLIRI